MLKMIRRMDSAEAERESNMVPPLPFRRFMIAMIRNRATPISVKDLNGLLLRDR
jgi:hypothetical protein